MQVVSQQKQKASIGIGVIESRDLRFNPYSSQNLKDLLAFELMARGYQAQTSDLSFVQTARLETLRARMEALNKPGKKDETSDLMPPNLRGVAGELRPMDNYMQTGEAGLTRDEIQKVVGRDQIDYYLQGSISRSESGNVLEIEESFLVMMNVFNREGMKIAAIGFAVRGNSLQDSEFMKAVCSRIARGFDEQIGLRGGKPSASY